MASAGLTYALNNGSTEEQYYKQIFDAFVKAQSQGLSDAQIEIAMNQYGISADDLAQATGVTPESVQTRMDVAAPTTEADLAYERAAQAELATRQAQEDARLASLLETVPEVPEYVAPVAAPVTAPVVAPVTAPTGLLETPVATPVTAPVTAPVGLLETPVTSPVVAPVAESIAAPSVTTGANMATSAALNYALNNGMTQAQFDKRIFDAVLAAQQPGSTTTNAMLRSEMDRLGISPEDVARATGVTTQSVQEKYNVALPKTNAELIADAAADAELAARTARDVTATPATIATAQQAATTSQGLLGAADKTAATAAAAALAVQQKAAADAQAVINAKAAADAKAAAALKTKTTATTTTQTGLNAQLEKAYKDGDIALLNSLLAQNQVTSAQAKNMFNLTDADLSWIQNNAGGKFYTPPTATPPTATPGANMGIGGSFANFQSIPIGAQYNPAVTAGGASPYSQIMGQMKPFTNPYQNFVANTPMGGYDPGLYDRIETANLAKAQAEAEIERLGGVNVYGAGNSGGDGGGVGGGGIGVGDGDGSVGDSDGGGAGDAGDGVGYAMGGMVNSLLGPNPAGPDDGMAALDRGEYVIKKSAVNKYGRGLLDMINEGKVPAKKMKSLLG